MTVLFFFFFLIFDGISRARKSDVRDRRNAAPIISVKVAAVSGRVSETHARGSGIGIAAAAGN